MNDETYLNDVWCFYFHDPYTADWTNESYKLLGTISTVEEFWHHHVMIKEHISKGMFFLMREYCFPAWDDPSNINGGCLSIKVLKEHVADFYEDICVKLLGENLLKDEFKHMWDNINGVSVSPKKHFCIIKVWLKADDVLNVEHFNFLSGYYGDIIYKSNRENIQNNHAKN